MAVTYQLLAYHPQGMSGCSQPSWQFRLDDDREVELWRSNETYMVNGKRVEKGDWRLYCFEAGCHPYKRDEEGDFGWRAERGISVEEMEHLYVLCDALALSI